MRSETEPGLTIGLDATNLLAGGGRTHLIEILGAVEAGRHGVSRIVVWGASETLACLPDRAWLEKRNPPELDGDLITRTRWQNRELADAVRAERCDILFVPGGNVLGNFAPVVTMSRNALPFEMSELLRYGASLSTLRFLILRFSQGRSFSRADGVIFLNAYAQRLVTGAVRRLKGQTAIIPHGVSDRFFMPPRPQRAIESCTEEDPFRLLYVSTVELYKHQWVLVRAVAELRRRTGWPLVLELVGSGYPPAVRKLDQAVRLADPEGRWVKRRGATPHSELRAIYAEADIGVFASSCENMPNILLETMAAGLPVACSSREPMPEMLGDAGVFFDPEDAEDIAASLETLIASVTLREQKASAAFEKAQQYSWRRCADQTFAFLESVAQGHAARPRIEQAVPGKQGRHFEGLR